MASFDTLDSLPRITVRPSTGGPVGPAPVRAAGEPAAAPQSAPAAGASLAASMMTVGGNNGRLGLERLPARRGRGRRWRALLIGLALVGLTAAAAVWRGGLNEDASSAGQSAKPAASTTAASAAAPLELETRRGQ